MNFSSIDIKRVFTINFDQLPFLKLHNWIIDYDVKYLND